MKIFNDITLKSKRIHKFHLNCYQSILFCNTIFIGKIMTGYKLKWSDNVIIDMNNNYGINAFSAVIYN